MTFVIYPWVMKQIAKTAEVIARLRTSYGADANLDALAVYEAIALNTLPLRKTGGLFQGARASLSLLTEMAASINAESVPLRIEHFSDDTPYGRIFYGQVLEDELRVMFAVDKTTSPDIVAKLDSGTIDQVSVGMQNKHLNCSKCGFDYMAAGAEMNRWTLECADGHEIGQEGTFLWIDGLNIFLETSLVGTGAGRGARIVGPTDARLQNSQQFDRLAASAKDSGVGVLLLSPTAKDIPVDLTQLTARVETLAGELAVMRATAEQVPALQARIVELEPAAAELESTRADLTAAQEAVAEAVTLLTAEAKAVLVACGEATDNVPDTVAGLVELIADRRAKFAAVIPVNGASNSADSSTETVVSRPTSAFRAR